MDSFFSNDALPDSSEPIEFVSEDIDFEPSDVPALESWIRNIIDQEKCRLGFLNFIFCSDDFLLNLNEEYLGHDTLTDIITFPYQSPPFIEGDVFISVERVRENAQDFGVPFDAELHRVMIHGVLHLCGYKDKTEEEQAVMRQKEDAALALFPSGA